MVDRAGRTLSVDTRAIRIAGASAVGLALAVPLLPGHDTVTCPLRAMTGVPCPFCGMTRGIGRALRGDLANAFLLNPASLVLVLGLVASVLLVRRRTIRIPAWSVVAVFAALWSFQIVKLATGQPL